MPLQIRQIVMNLTANAIKFTAARAHRRRPRRNWLATAISVQMRLSVRDEGIGIAADVQDKIFDVFTQADGTVTRRYGGTGLGLAIVKQLAQLMGGTVALDSEIGKGSTFIVDLPLECDPGRVEPAARSRRPPGDGGDPRSRTCALSATPAQFLARRSAMVERRRCRAGPHRRGAGDGGRRRVRC